MSSQLEFTGERIVPGRPPVYLVRAHTARYQHVAPQVVGRTVLDLGSGEGYGTAYLAPDWVDRVNPGTFRFEREHLRGATYSVAACRTPE